jgi:pantoate--beta-alanine ligase
MDTVATIAEVRSRIADARRAGKVIAFVPTMGALHAGHASLIDAAASRGGLTVVSIFVNPTQFAPTEDLAKYPRTPDADAELCSRHGADLIFAPRAEEMYPAAGSDGRPGTLTQVQVPQLSGTLCGASRPGHFTGVCTVVAKLFNIVLPDVAFFGAKDFQQAAVIRRMSADLNFPIEIVICPTVRESDGLAMSSRNAYLTAKERREAPGLYAALRRGAEVIAAGERSPMAVRQAMCDVLAAQTPVGRIDYAAVADPDTLRDVQHIDGPVLLALAVRLGRARLIDNMVVDARAAGT